MRVKKLGAASLLALLILSGCGEGSGGHSPEPDNGLRVAARFQAEGGATLEGSAARFSAGEHAAGCLLDGSGEITVSGLPRNGELLLTLLDRRQEIQGAMTLSFSEGAVIDATTGDDGIGHITVRGDTDEVALTFVLTEDGALRCALWLAADFQ